MTLQEQKWKAAYICALLATPYGKWLATECPGTLHGDLHASALAAWPEWAAIKTPEQAAEIDGNLPGDEFADENLSMMKINENIQLWILN